MRTLLNVDALRNILAALTILFAVIGIARALRQRSYSDSGLTVTISVLLGFVLLLGFAVSALAYSSWRLLGLGYALYGMVAALGFDAAMLFLSPSTKQHVLVGLVKNLPWWSGVLVSLLRLEWLPIIVGILVSVVLHWVLPPTGGRGQPGAQQSNASAR